ncbi:hypothetical protein [Adhaeretor mobilis]|uniref:Uncharacterized protein n=1 Tax=Adhaeretor mobilis TaxID=1930276 RepID=A0A517MR00_9BACT|nr:hypothetical protein [Adhaeretor mobilis]QDS97314.1 hypothetical protein HG15A2_05750 [Adhaeretor mobilis]
MRIRKNKYNRIIVIAIVLVCLALLFQRRNISAAAKESLVARRDSLSLGMTPAQAKCQLAGDSKLMLHAEPMAEAGLVTWRLSTPLEFGARNWVLIAVFLDGKLVAHGIRTADSDFEKPAIAPKDKMVDSPDVGDIWNSRFIVPLGIITHLGTVAVLSQLPRAERDPHIAPIL